jgi:hypothetical protein
MIIVQCNNKTKYIPISDPNLRQEYILKCKTFKRANKVRINKVNPKKTNKGDSKDN